MPATRAQQEAFAERFTDVALEVSRQTGVSPEVVLGQTALETGWGMSAPQNNMFGIKGRGQTVTTQEHVPGKGYVTVKDSFRSYADPRESFRDYANVTIRGRPMSDIVKPGMSIEQQARAIKAAGYATDPLYAKSLAATARNVRGLTAYQNKVANAAAVPPAQVNLDDIQSIPALEQINGVEWNDDFSFDSFTDELGNFHEFAGFVDDPMAPEAYDVQNTMSGWEYADDLGGVFSDDIANGMSYSFSDDPMQSDAYGGSVTGSMSNMGGWEYSDGLGGNFQDDIKDGMSFDFVGTDDPMGPASYGPATASFTDDPMMGHQYGGGYYSEDMPDDPMNPDAYGPATASWSEDPMAGGQYGYGVADIPAEDDAYGTGYATPTETVVGNVEDDAWGSAGYRDDLGDYAEYTGEEDPMAPDAYGAATASWGEDPMQPDAYDSVTPETMPTATSGIPASVSPAPARSISTTPPAQPAAFAPPQARTQAPQQQTPTSSWGVPSRSPVQRSAPAQPSVPFGRVGGTGDPAATTMRSDRTIADNQGLYGGKDAFGPNDAFGGMGFSRSAYGGYADVLDSYDRALGQITRTVTDRYGNVMDRQSVNAGGGWDGRPTGENSSGNAERGDGSYSESSGRNDNNPQGIL